MTPATVREAVPSQDDIEAEWMRLPSFVRNKWGAVITNIVWMARRQERNRLALRAALTGVAARERGVT